MARIALGHVRGRRLDQVGRHVGRRHGQRRRMNGIHAVASGLSTVPTRMPIAIGLISHHRAPFEYGQVVEQVCASLFHQRILVRVEATT